MPAVKVMEYYGDATDEADECLAKIQAIANQQAVTTFPKTHDIQKLTTAMSQMEKAIADSAVLASLVVFVDTVLKTIQAKGVK